MQGKVFVDAAQSGNEMIFEGADGAFGCVAAMGSRRYQLVINSLLSREFLQCIGALIIQFL
jgi:hypothetical protein